MGVLCVGWYVRRKGSGSVRYAESVEVVCLYFVSMEARWRMGDLARRGWGCVVIDGRREGYVRRLFLPIYSCLRRWLVLLKASRI